MQNLVMVTAAIDYIEAHLTEKLNLDDVAAAVHYSRYHLHRVFREVVGISIHDYAQRRQLTEAAKLLAFSEKRILDIAIISGYKSQQAFTNVFKEMYKQSPGEFREKEEYYALQLEYEFKSSPALNGATSIKLREIIFATEQDIPAWMELVRLVIDGFPHLDESEHEQSLRRYIEKRGALITKEGGKIIGAMMINYDTGSIDFLGVHPLYRKQGLNRLFLDKALGELLRHKNITTTTFRAGDRADIGQRQALQELGFAEGELLMEFGYPTQRMLLPNPATPGGEGVE